MSYPTAVIAQLGRVTNQAELDALSAIALPAMDAQIASVSSAAALVAPLAALASASLSTLPTVVTFLQDFQSVVLGPQAASAGVLAAQGPALVTERAAIVAAIAAAQGRIDS